MNYSINMAAKRYVDGTQLTEGMHNRVEALRAPAAVARILELTNMYGA